MSENVWLWMNVLSPFVVVPMFIGLFIRFLIWREHK